MKHRTEAHGFHLSYHWIVAAVAFVMVFFHGGAANNLTGLHIIPITEHLNISRSDFTLAWSSKSICEMFTTLFSGFLLAKFGYRKCVCFGLIGCSLSYFVMSAASSLIFPFLSGVLLGLCSTFCATAGASRLVSNWFCRYRGTVLGLVTSASGLGGSVLCIVQTALIEAFSWKASLIAVSALLLICAILVPLVVRNHPSEMGLAPLGDGEEVIGKRRKSLEKVKEGLPFSQLLKTPSFYGMALATFFSGFGLYMVFTVVVPHFREGCQFSASSAGFIQSFMLLFLTATKLGAGFLSDLLGSRRVAVLCQILSSLSLLMLILISSFPLAVVAITLYTAALPMVTIMPPLIALSLFGYRAQPQYTGVFLALISVSSFAGSYVSNLIFDLLGSYRPSFAVALLFSVLAILLYLFTFFLAKKEDEGKKASA
ncbi:MAG: MFS transporter [Clostridia bacterium]|nr:MFS transporter [Clostridia bacterium]